MLSGNDIDLIYVDEIEIDKDLKCLECGLLHCDYFKKTKYVKQCPNLRSKLKNKYRKLQNFVYFNLEKFGNSVISEQVYNKLGKKAVVKDLEQNGFTNIYISMGTYGSIIVTADKRKD